MYRNRDQVFDRLEMAVGLGFELAALGPYAEALSAGNETDHG